MRYTATALALHWIMAAALLAMLALGLVMTGMDNAHPLKFSLYQWHKSVGVTLLLLALLRLGWRLARRPPPLPAAMPRWEAAAAYGAHWGLYALMLALPITGWLMVSASPWNIPTVLYNIIPWPHIPGLANHPEKAKLAEWFDTAHEWLAWALMGLIALHVLASLKHHYINRDDILSRMIPWLKPKE